MPLLLFADKLLILHSHVTYALQLLNSHKISRNSQFSRKGLQSDIFCSHSIWAVSQMNLPTNSYNLYLNLNGKKFLASIIRINFILKYRSSYYWRVICHNLNSMAMWHLTYLFEFMRIIIYHLVSHFHQLYWFQFNQVYISPHIHSKTWSQMLLGQDYSWVIVIIITSSLHCSGCCDGGSGVPWLNSTTNLWF